MTTRKLVAPFRSWHYEWLAAKGPASDRYTVKSIQAISSQLQAQNSWTGVVDGDPVVCAGTLEQWPGRHIAWAYLAPDTAKHMLWITREVKKALSRVEGRIELTVRSDFPAGLKWAELLGFEIETPCLKRFGPSNEDHTGFVRFN